MGSAHGWSQSFHCREQTCIDLSWKSQQLENISFQPQQNSSSWCCCENHKNHLSGFQLHAQPWAPGRHSLFLIPLPALQHTGMSRVYHTKGEGWEGCTGHRTLLPTLMSPTPDCQLTQGSCSVHTRRVLLSRETKFSQGRIRKLKNPSITMSAGKNEIDSWICKKPYF